MPRRLKPSPALPLTLFLLGAASAACTPITAYNGFQARDDKPASMKVGEDSKSTVLTKLGSPSTKSEFGADTWYYISQTTSQASYHRPQLETRNITAIRFDKDEKVDEVKNYDLHNGYRIAMDNRATPTRGRQVNWIEQILGTIGAGGALPQDADPGNPRGGSGGGIGGGGR